jgi:hypothetical protein
VRDDEDWGCQIFCNAHGLFGYEYLVCNAACLSAIRHACGVGEPD